MIFQPDRFQNLSNLLTATQRQLAVFIDASSQIIPERFRIVIIAQSNGHTDNRNRRINFRRPRNRRRSGLQLLNRFRLSADGALSKQCRDAEHARPSFLKALMQIEQQQRITANLKEALINIQRLGLRNHLQPQRFDLLLERGKRFFLRFLLDRKRASLNSFSVGLSGRTQRNFIDLVKDARAHIFRQIARQLVPNLCARKHCIFMRQQEGFQRIVAADFTHAHHRLRNAGAAVQRRFHFAQFNPESANLYLIVVAAQIFNISIGGPAAQIARPIHSVAFDQRIVQEALCGEVFPIGIAAGHLHAADIQLAHNAQRDPLKMLVQHVHLRVAHRATDRNNLRRRLHTRVPRNVDRRFRRPVEIVQLRRQQRLESNHQIARQRLAAGEDIAQAGEPLHLFRERLQIIQKRTEHRRNKV